jgi:hypothetical protein
MNWRLKILAAGELGPADLGTGDGEPYVGWVVEALPQVYSCWVLKQKIGFLSFVVGGQGCELPVFMSTTWDTTSLQENTRARRNPWSLQDLWCAVVKFSPPMTSAKLSINWSTIE